jgi:hypothetical protein
VLGNRGVVRLYRMAGNAGSDPINHSLTLI